MAPLSLRLRQLALLIAIGSLAACGLLPSDPDDNDYSYAVGANRDTAGAPKPEVPPVEVAPAPSPADYVVQRGDTMYSIAFRHGMDWRALADLNGIGPPYTIRLGQELRLHPPYPAAAPSESPRREPDAPRVALAEPPRPQEEPRGAEARPLRNDRPPQQLQVETVTDTRPPRNPIEPMPSLGDTPRGSAPDAVPGRDTVGRPESPVPAREPSSRPADGATAAADRDRTVVLPSPSSAIEPVAGSARTQGVADAGNAGGRVESLGDAPPPPTRTPEAPSPGADSGRPHADAPVTAASETAPANRPATAKNGALAQAVGTRTRPGDRSATGDAAKPSDGAVTSGPVTTAENTSAAAGDPGRGTRPVALASREPTVTSPKPESAPAAATPKPDTAAEPTSPADPADKPRPAVASVSHVDPTAVLVGPKRTVDGVAWQWPASGALLSRFLPGDSTHQGIEVAGKEGSGVHAAADGEVVYSGNGLVGYGELIIIKHNNEFLSAYARNSRRLVKEGDKVKAGQAIAEIGRGGSTVDAVHFEIRRSGKPDDPLKYLPARN